MAAGGATLVAWSLVGDLLWLRPTAQRLKQKGAPKPGAAKEWFEQELARVKQHIAEQNLKIVRTPEDVDRALKGEPHVVLAIEGASFVDDGAGQLKAAYDAGVRHVQLVHYIKNTIGDFQTEKPTHNGLSAFGKTVGGGMQPARHADRPGALHGRCGDAGAGALQGADGVVAQLGDADAASRIGRCRPARRGS